MLLYELHWPKNESNMVQISLEKERRRTQIVVILPLVVPLIEVFELFPTSLSLLANLDAEYDNQDEEDHIENVPDTESEVIAALAGGSPKINKLPIDSTITIKWGVPVVLWGFL